MSGEILSLPTRTGSVTLASLVAGSTTGDVVSWNGTTWVAAAGVSASGSTTINGLARWSDTSHLAIKDSPFVISDAGEFSVSGTKVLLIDQSSLRNISMGNNALLAPTSGRYNAAYGYETLKNTTSGGYNTAYGYQALTTNVSAGENSAFGYQSLYNSTNGFNTAVGKSAGYDISIGTYNTLLGHTAGTGITTGNYNTCIGTNATASATSIESISLGYGATGVSNYDITIGGSVGFESANNLARVAATATRVVRIKINGTTLYLLADTVQ